MSILYAIYAFIIGGIDLQAGFTLVKREGWERIVGLSAIGIGVIAFIAGFQALLGFSINPLLLLIPLVGAGFVIMLESWKRVKERGGIGSVLIALYNTFAWLWDLAQLIYLLQRRRE